MPSFLARTDLSRCDLKLSLRNSEGYLVDASCVRYTVYAWDGLPVSGRSLRAARRSVGEYYAPWRVDVGNGAYKVVWELSDGCCDSDQEVVENIFVVDPSDYVCGPSGLKQSAIPPKGSGTFINGAWLGPGDLPLFLKDPSGLPFTPFAVFWTVYDAAGRAVSLKTVASQVAIGEYYAQWVVAAQSGDYYIQWEFVSDPDSPTETARMDFSVICPSEPFARSFSTPCWSDDMPTCMPKPIRSNFIISSCECAPAQIPLPCQPCSLPTSIPSGFVPPSPSSCCIIEVARTLHLQATLPPGGQYTNQASFSLLPGLDEVTFYVTYIRGAPGGFVSLRLFWGNGIEETQETLIDGSFTPLSTSTVQQNMSLLDYFGPVPTNNDPISFILYVDIPGGSNTVRLKAAEGGAIGTPGTVSITLTASN